ncbi:MAG: hypothetical protein IT416_04045 [Candidatus Pacebacteria bacterium]|nr:hypothetical protein [Candidatus Paceibacterota bacterium]
MVDNNTETEKLYFGELMDKLVNSLTALFADGKLDLKKLETLVGGFVNQPNAESNHDVSNQSLPPDLMENHIRGHLSRVKAETYFPAKFTEKIDFNEELFLADIKSRSEKIITSRVFDSQVINSNKGIFLEIYKDQAYVDKALPLFINNLKDNFGSKWNQADVEPNIDEKKHFSRRVQEEMVKLFKENNKETENLDDEEIWSILCDGYRVGADVFSNLLSRAMDSSVYTDSDVTVKSRCFTIFDSFNNRRSISVLNLEVTYSEKKMSDLAQQKLDSWSK